MRLSIENFILAWKEVEKSLKLWKEIEWGYQLLIIYRHWHFVSENNFYLQYPFKEGKLHIEWENKCVRNTQLTAQWVISINFTQISGKMTFFSIQEIRKVIHHSIWLKSKYLEFELSQHTVMCLLLWRYFFCKTW